MPPKPTSRLCSMEGCDRPHYGRGYCAKHYRRWTRQGDAMTAESVRDLSPVERFMTHVNKTASCWEWTGALTWEGYGQFRVDRDRLAPAHRWLYEQMSGPVAAELSMDHLCRNRKCVRPDHLQPVTPRVNTRRGEAPPFANAKKTHCIRGHPFDEANTHIRSDGGRTCRACWTVKRRQKGIPPRYPTTRG